MREWLEMAEDGWPCHWLHFATLLQGIVVWMLAHEETQASVLWPITWVASVIGDMGASSK